MILNTKKEWNFVITETHNEVPNNRNLTKRETLFIMQVLLSKIKPMNKNAPFLKETYAKLKEHYITQ